MKVEDLEIFNAMPFFFWVKDAEGRYVWCNRAMSEVANEKVVGKTDYELPWSASADALRADDKIVLDMGKPIFVHEYADDPKRGKVALSVCKFVGELDGKRYAFGVSFVIE
ncbi:MAG: PAS domain-containing protein [Hyphomicrobium sp.]